MAHIIEKKYKTSHSLNLKEGLCIYTSVCVYMDNVLSLKSIVSAIRNLEQAHRSQWKHEIYVVQE